MRGKRAVLQAPEQRLGITPAHAGKTTRRAVSRSSRPGSPPRMRGKLVGDLWTEPGRGITPAHAGKTHCQKYYGMKYRDHPRACGENRYVSFALPCGAGSPPRMRGKLKKYELAYDGEGITPAHAGKTAAGMFSAYQFVGSPPRMRGKRNLVSVNIPRVGITPAHAGKTEEV